jgi:hypothetical protein
MMGLFQRLAEARQRALDPDAPGDVPGTPVPSGGAPDASAAGNQPDDLAKKLERTTHVALDKNAEILSLPLPSVSDPAFGVVSRAQTAAASTIIGAQLKADENHLRASVPNRLPELLEILKEEQQRYAERQAQRLRDDRSP